MPMPSLRDQLLTAGLETLHRRGFNATSVQDITDAAGAPKGSFYNHFESKEALALEALERYLENARPRRAILADARLPPLRRLRRYFERNVEAAVDAGLEPGCLLGNFGNELSSQSTPIRKRVDQAFSVWTDAVAAVIGRAQQEGAIESRLPPKALAEFVIQSWEGALLRAKVAKSRAPLDLFLKLTFSKILA
jgi:TetR/AcrR family transcriptional repressor of nem operon